MAYVGLIWSNVNISPREYSLDVGQFVEVSIILVYYTDVFQREWQSDTYWERYKLNISDITLRLGNKDVFWSSESDSTANQNAKVGHIWSHIDILFVHYILITNFLNSLNPLSFWFFIQINEKKTNMKNIGYYKILFCSIQVWSIATKSLTSSIQLTAITIVTVMAPRWLERHEQSFITLATIIQVKTVQGLPDRDHLDGYLETEI